MSVSWWQLGAASNAVVALAYLGICGAIVASLRRERQWRANPLAMATAAIFFTCAVHHGSHAVHLLWPGSHDDGHSMRAVYGGVWLSGWDLVTAGVGVRYWTLRNRFPALVRGAALFDDLEVRRRQAMELHDGVVQGLATAKLARELGHLTEAAAELERSIETSKSIITDLLLHDPEFGSPGSVRRRGPASP